MENDNYTYELEQALTKLVDFFEPGVSSDTTYLLENDKGEIFYIGEEMAQAVDHALNIIYGETIDD